MKLKLICLNIDPKPGDENEDEPSAWVDGQYFIFGHCLFDSKPSNELHIIRAGRLIWADINLAIQRRVTLSSSDRDNNKITNFGHLEFPHRIKR